MLSITGRVKEQYKLQNGKYVVPSAVEAAMMLNPFVLQACMYGDNRPYNIALVVPDAVKLAARLGAEAATVLQTHPKEVRQMLLDEIKHQCSKASVRSYERVSGPVIY